MLDKDKKVKKVASNTRKYRPPQKKQTKTNVKTVAKKSVITKVIKKIDIGYTQRSIVILHGVFESNFYDLLKKKKLKNVFVLEGRPSLNTARISCRELLKRDIKPTLIADNMAGFLFYKNLVREVCLSYELADTDGALCKIGGLILSVLGKKHKVSVNLYPDCMGLDLLGNPKEICNFLGVKVAPDNIKGYVPLVEWVPRKYYTKVYS